MILEGPWLLKCPVLLIDAGYALATPGNNGP